jgi:sarcosine oxidase gamma subunit
MTAARYPLSITRAPLATRFDIVGGERSLVDIVKAAGLPVPASPSTVATGAGHVRIAWIGPRRMIVTAALDARARLGAALRSGVPRGAAVVVADVTGATTTFVLKGSGIEPVLAQGIAHDVSSLAERPDRVLAVDGWGVAAILEAVDEGIAVTVDASFGDYVEHMLYAAAGLATSSKPGIMSAPPPPIRIAD